MADDPPYLTVGTEVSAKYKGAFCEAKIRKVVRVVKCKVTFKQGNGSALLTDDVIKGNLRIGAVVEAKHPDRGAFLEATINKIQDCSQYTVVFDDGDITTLRRSALCLKSGRHFNESETLDQLPLTHPEHFSNPVVGGRRGASRRRAAEKGESSDEEEEDEPPARKDGRRKYEKELDMGKVVWVESTDKKKSRDQWFPALVVSPGAQETVKIKVKDEYLVRSFRDGRYYTVPKKEITEFTKDSPSKYDSNSNVQRSAVEKALQFLDKDELPPHWDREVLFQGVRGQEEGSAGEAEEVSEKEESEAEEEEAGGHEERDRFIAQLYKYLDDRGTPMNKVPQVCFKDLDMHKLFKMVMAKGGGAKVNNIEQGWKTVTIKLGYGHMPTTSTVNLVKQAYKKYLSNFEEFYRKLGSTWMTNKQGAGKARSSRSIYRERATPSSSRDSTRDSKKGEGDEDGEGGKGKAVKERSQSRSPEMDTEEEEAAAASASAVAVAKGAVEKEKKVVPAATTEEPPRKSSRGRQPKKRADDEDVASSPGQRKKRQQNVASSASRERDSSVASSTKEEGPPTPSSAKKGVGRGKWKRKGAIAEEEKKEKEAAAAAATVVKEEEKEEEKVETGTGTMSDVRLGDKLEVYYPKSGKTYEAKVIDLGGKNETILVHYLGWNNRYDEWIDRSRISENVTLRLEQTGGVEKEGTGKGAKQRKGRNSSSATSNASSSGGPPKADGPAGTRASKGKDPPSTPSSSVNREPPGLGGGSKRRRSTSSEIIPATPPAPKRRRTRQKSGADESKTQASDSEEPSSDSDEKSIKSDKVSIAPSSSDVESKKKGDLGKKESEKKDMLELSEEVDKKEENSSGSSSSGGMMDLNQIRLEMKGLDKMVVGKRETSSLPSPPINVTINTSVSSPAPPTLAAVGSSPPPPPPTKVDIYEFEEDGAEDTPPPPITPSAPKLKMFSPVARTTAPPQAPPPVVEKPREREVVVEKSAPPPPEPKVEKETPPPPTPEKKTPQQNPVVSLEKIEVPTKATERAAAAAAERAKAPEPQLPEPHKEAPKLTPPPPVIKETPKVTPPPPPVLVMPRAAREEPKEQPKSTPTSVVVVSTSPSVIISTPPPPPLAVSSTATSTPVVTKPPPLPILTSPPVIVSVASTVPSSSVVSLGTPVIISTSSKMLSAKTSAAKIAASLPSPIAARIALAPGSGSQQPSTVLLPVPTSTLLTPSTGVSSSASSSNFPTVSTPSVVTLTPVISSTSSGGLGGASSVQSPSPPVLLQQATIRPLIPSGASVVRHPVITLSSSGAASSASGITPPSDKPAAVLPMVATVGSGAIRAIIPNTYSALKRAEFGPRLHLQPAGEGSTSSIPTISIISATSLKPQDLSSQAPTSVVKEVPQPPQQQSTPPPPLPVPTVPLKVAATIPPPQLVVKQQPPPPVSTPPPPPKPVYGPGPVNLTPAPIDTPKQKKKKQKTSQGSTPQKMLAPLPSSGAPPPPPVQIPPLPSSITATPTSVGPPPTMVTPTPGRKTPVKKRLPPPMDSPGKPVKSLGMGSHHAPPSKPGKMNPEAMNAAIASVGATPPIPTTVITSTSALFHGPPGGGVIFTSTAPPPTLPPPPPVVVSQPPPPPVNIMKPSQPPTIKSSAESIAASIAAVASMGGTSASRQSMPTVTVSSGKSGMPTKRFMKEGAPPLPIIQSPKDTPRMYGGPPPPVVSQPPPPPVVLTKQPSVPTTPPPPPPTAITIHQAKFPPAHGMQQGSMPQGPAITLVKANQMQAHHPPHLLEPHKLHPNPHHHQPAPVIILPSVPQVISQGPYAHHHHGALKPVIMSKPLTIEGPSTSLSSSGPGTGSGQVLMSAAPSQMLKANLLPITVTPSNVQVSSVPVTLTQITTPSNLMSSSGAMPPHVEMKPVVSSCGSVSVQELPPSITVTKATSVMKAISPDIVAVSSYNPTHHRNAPYSSTPLKREEPPEIVVKPAPASAQIVFHTGSAPEPKKLEMITTTLPPKQQAVVHPPPVRQPPPPPISLTSGPGGSVVVTKVEMPDEENSLLCEEIIPGSPTTGEGEDDKRDVAFELEDKIKLEDERSSPPVSSPALPPSPLEEEKVEEEEEEEEEVMSGGLPAHLEEEFEEEKRRRREEFLQAQGDDDDFEGRTLEERSVDSPMGPPSEGREADLPFRDSFSEGGGDHTPPSSPSTTSTISTDNSSRRHDRHHRRHEMGSRLSPTPEGGSSKSKDSDEEDDDLDSDVGSKSTHLDDTDSKHGSTRGSTRIRSQTSRMGRSPSPSPGGKRRRLMNRRNKSPDDGHYTPRTIRTSSGRKVTPVGRHGDMMMEREMEKERRQPPPPPLVNLAKPPKTGRFNFIPNLGGIGDPEQRITLISQAINELKEQYQKTKTEAASFDRRVKRWKRRVREKERLARQEATRAAS